MSFFGGVGTLSEGGGGVKKKFVQALPPLPEKK